MKKILTAALLVFSVGAAEGALLAHEAFDYEGNLEGQSGGLGFDTSNWTTSIVNDLSSMTGSIGTGLSFGTGGYFLRAEGGAVNFVVVNDDDTGGFAEWNRGLDVSLGAGQALWMSFLFKSNQDISDPAGRSVLTTINGVGENLDLLPKRNGVALPTVRITGAGNPARDLSGSRVTDTATYLAIARFGLNTSGNPGSVDAWVLSESNFNEVAADGSIGEAELRSLTNVHATASVTNVLTGDALLDAGDQFQFQIGPRANNATLDLVFDELRIADALADVVPLTDTQSGVLNGLTNDAMTSLMEISGLSVINAGNPQVRAGRFDPDDGTPPDNDSQNMDVVYVFQLPDFGEVLSPFVSATLSFRLNNISGSPDYHADLYGIQARDASTVLPDDFYFDVPDDTRPGMTKLQGPILETNTAPGRITSLDISDWLNAQYAGGINAGKFAFLRITPVGDPGFFDVSSGFMLAAAEDPDPQDRPLIDYEVQAGIASNAASVIALAAHAGGVSALPFSASFESYTLGSSVLGLDGWAAATNGSYAWPVSSTYPADYQGTFPLLDAHTRHLVSVGKVDQTFLGTDGLSNTWVDLVAHLVPHEGALPDAAPDDQSHVAFLVSSNGLLAVGHGVDDGGLWGWTWTELPGITIGTNQFFRLTVQGDYERDPAGLFYYRLWVDGLAVTNPMTWFPAGYTNENLLGRLSVMGRGTEVDDVVVAEERTLDLRTITVTHTAHGTVTPSGAQQVQSGGSKTFALDPDPLYHVGGVTVDGMPRYGSADVTVSNVTSDVDLHVEFEANRVFSGVPAWWLAESHPGWSNNMIVHASQDEDLDGMPTWMEYHAGTDATNAASLFLLEIGKSNAAPEIYVDTVAADPRDQAEGLERIYSLEQADEQDPASWGDVPGMTNIVGSGQREAFVPALGGQDSVEEYRATVEVTDPARTNARPPNFILLLTDDQGWGDAAFMGHPYALTPNLDRLASEGTVFTQFYVNGSVCSPSRASFMTGHYPARLRIHGHLVSDPSENAARDMVDFLDPGAPTITSILQSNGYATAHFGKWHLGNTRGAPTPAAYGIEDHAVRLSKGTSLFDSPYYDQFDPAFVDDHGHDVSTAAIAYETARFLEENQGRPFYINFWTLLPHTPLNPTPEQAAVYDSLVVSTNDFTSWMRDYFADASDPSSQMKTYCASLTAMDDGIGMLLDKLDELGLAENTVILFTSDNGPEDYEVASAVNAGVGSPGPLRARKRSLYEGGIRVPCIVRWPGRVPVGQVNTNSVFAAVDWLPTVMQLAGIDMPELSPPTDGEDMSDVLMGVPRLRTRPLHWEWRYEVRHPEDYLPPTLAIRNGDWKLYMENDGSGKELYNVISDPEERINRAGLPQHSNRVDNLSLQLELWKASLP